MGSTSRWARARRWALAGSAVAGSLALAAGVAPAGASVSRLVGKTTVAATYACSTVVLGTTHTFTSPIAITGTFPTTVKPGGSVSMTGFQAKVTIPSTLVATAEQYGVTWFSGHISTWYINSTDAKVKSVNAAGSTGIVIPKLTLPKPAASISVKVPAIAKTVGPWIAVAAGTMTFTDGGLHFTLADNLGVSLTVNCSPHPAVTLGHTTVS